MDTTIISDEQLGNALRYLAETDHDYAKEKAELERSDILRRRSRSRMFLLAEGNNEERKAKADTSADVEHADEAYCENVEAFETLKAKRERAEIVVRVYQTLEATRRAKL